MQNIKYQSQYKWRKNNPEKITAYCRIRNERIKNNPEKYAKTLQYQKDYQKRWKINNPEKYKEMLRKYAEKRRNGKPAKEKKPSQKQIRLDFLTKQQNRCAICGLEVKLYLDHCHKTGKNRGMLCNACNVMLGFSRDNTEILSKAIKYLENFKNSLVV